MAKAALHLMIDQRTAPYSQIKTIALRANLSQGQR
jgi:hypothetical protein